MQHESELLVVGALVSCNTGRFQFRGPASSKFLARAIKCLILARVSFLKALSLLGF